jgi:hypothetical protein
MTFGVAPGLTLKMDLPRLASCAVTTVNWVQKDEPPGATMIGELGWDEPPAPEDDDEEEPPQPASAKAETAARTALEAIRGTCISCPRFDVQQSAFRCSHRLMAPYRRPTRTEYRVYPSWSSQSTGRPQPRPCASVPSQRFVEQIVAGTRQGAGLGAAAKEGVAEGGAHLNDA